MEFHIPCRCGYGVCVTEGAAGATATCRCGRTLSVPSLNELRLQAGLSPNVSPELVIEHLLATGQFPFGKSCLDCTLETDNVVEIVAECERGWQGTGGFSWVALLISVLFLHVHIFAWERGRQESFGRNKTYPLPLPVCDDCLPRLRGRKAIKEHLQRIPEYARLLEKFPDARLTLQRPPKRPAD